MTERALYSKLHDIVLPLEGKVDSGINAYKTQVRSGNYMPHETTNPLVVTVDWLIEEERVVQQLKELAKGEINIVSLNTLDFDELVHIQNIRVRERGGLVDQWQVQGEFNLVGRDWHWIVDGEEIVTDWDTIVDTVTFDSTADCNEGETMSDGTNTWRALIGDWTIHADDYLYCDNDLGWNHCAIDKLYYADVKVTCDVYNPTDFSAGVTVRNTSTGVTSYGYGYSLIYYPNDDTVTFYKWSGAGITALRQWSYTTSATTYYTIMLVAQGNKFDCYIEGEYLGTVFDDTYRVGYIGVSAGGISSRFDNFKMEIVKPVTVSLPVGAYGYNQIRMATTERMNDDICISGISRTVVAPDNPITFKEWSYFPENKRQSCMFYLECNEGYDTPFDHSGNDLHSSYMAATWIKDDFFGRTEWVIDVGSIDENIGVEMDAGGLPFPRTNSGTVELLIKFKPGQFEIVDAIFPIFWHWYQITTSEYLRIQIDGDEKLGVVYEANTWSGDTSVYDVTSTVLTWEANIWYHIVLTHESDPDGTTFRTKTVLYRNGVDVTDSAEYDDIPGWTNLWPAGITRMRWGYNAGWTMNNPAAFVKTCGVWTDSWSADEVRERYDQLVLNNPSGREVKVWDTMGEDGYWDYLELHLKLDENAGTNFYDSSKHNRTITETSISGNEWEIPSYCKWAKSGIHLDGNLDWFKASLDGENVDNHSWTLGGWFKLDDLTTSSGLWYLWDTTSSYATLYTDVNTNGSIYVKTDASTTDGEWTSATGVISAGEWYFIVVTWSGDITEDPILYVNGESYTWSSSTPISGTVGDADELHMGIATNTFDGYLDDIICLSTDIPASRVLFWYENMPNIVDESQWKRVYDEGHPFVGDMVVDNGLIRVSQTYQTRNPNTTYADEMMLKVNGYADGIWEDFPLYPSFYTSVYFTDYQVMAIERIEKYKVVIELEVKATTGDWIRTRWYVTQSPFVNIEIYDWSLVTNLRVGALTQSGFYWADAGYGHSPRFICMTLDTTLDATVDGSAFGDETEGLSVLFGNNRNIVQMVWNQSNNNYSCYDQTDTWSLIQDQEAIDNDVDVPSHWWAIGFMAFDTSLMNSNSWDDNSLTGAEAGNITINDYPAGGYRCWVYGTGAGGDESATFDVTGAIVDTGPVTWTTIVTGGEWSPHVDFVAESLDDITFTVTRTGGTGAITLGELVVVPVSNSKNFPLDYRNQALMVPSITKLGG